MASNENPFEKWLEEKLLSVNPEVDTDVFVMYINGILDTDTPIDETRESMMDILSEVVTDGQGENLCNEIIMKWQKDNNCNGGKGDNSESLAAQLSEMLEKQTIEAVKPKEKKSSNNASKRAILAQYANVSDGEDDNQQMDPGGDKGGGSGSGASDDPLLMKNTNVEDVRKIEKEKREKAKQEAEKKREKDKQDREAQKQKQQDRKDNEKKRTQKGERKR